MKATRKLHLLTTKLNSFRIRSERHGFWNILYARALKIINSVMTLRILRGVYIEVPALAFLARPAGYTAEFLTTAQLREYAKDPRTEMADAFLDQALARGDQCYGIRDGETLAAYGWYSSGGTPTGIADFEVSFDADWVYMYKGFTDTRYRGQRLHAIGMTRALQHYRSLRYRGLVSYVEAQNFDSLKSCFRMGYRLFGSVYVVGLFGRSFAFSSPGCRRFGFRLRHAPRAVSLCGIDAQA